MVGSVDGRASSYLDSTIFGDNERNSAVSEDGVNPTIDDRRFGRNDETTSQPVDRSRKKIVKDFFLNFPKKMFSHLPSFSAMLKSKPAEAVNGGDQTRRSELANDRASEHDVEIAGGENEGVGRAAQYENGVSPNQFAKNLKTLDAMTSGDNKLPWSVRMKMAQMPTLMEHLKTYADAGYTLEFLPDTPANARAFNDKDGRITFSLDQANNGPDDFINKFAETLLSHEAEKIPGQGDVASYVRNVETELPIIRRELENLKMPDLPSDAHTEISGTHEELDL